MPQSQHRMMSECRPEDVAPSWNRRLRSLPGGGQRQQPLPCQQGVSWCVTERAHETGAGQGESAAQGQQDRIAQVLQAMWRIWNFSLNCKHTHTPNGESFKQVYTLSFAFLKHLLNNLLNLRIPSNLQKNCEDRTESSHTV